MPEAVLPPSLSDPTPQEGSYSRTWKPLQVLNLYRLGLASLFVLLFHFGQLPRSLGSHDPRLFFITSLAYLLLAAVSMVIIGRRRPPFKIQLYTQVAIDIVVITLLMHASGGVSSGVGMLLVVSITNASMITASRTAGFFAAIASLAVLAQQSYTSLLDHAATSYSQAGFLGITLFATAILAQILARRARESEALAEQRGLDLANMAQVTDYVIQQMATGVLVIDHLARIRLMNNSAWKLSGQTPRETRNLELDFFCPELWRHYQQWRTGTLQQGVLHLSPTGQEVTARFISTGHDESAGTLVFLDDASNAARQAQQIKLASLGRLTASIAHEIRNPLGAISHAGQLLAESPDIGKGDRRLTEIILEQSRRMNGIVENVLQLGRRDRSEPERFRLAPWLAKFVSEFSRNNALAAGDLQWEVADKGLEVWFDPNHLNQILWNLCSNGLRHAAEATALPRLHLIGGVEVNGYRYLDVWDAGPGVAEEALEHIFEPFFTTEAAGNGLGLYISRELAEYNRARLEYLPKARGGGSRFRLLFGMGDNNK